MNRNSRLGKRRNSKGSRDSSASSSTREVRCGCQYFQTDSLLPERQSLVGTSLHGRNMGDHEYEPISPIDTKAVMPPPVMKVTDTEDEEAKSQQVHNNYDNHEHHFIRIPLDNELLVLGGKTEEQDIEDTSDEKEISTQEHQQIMEDRYFSPTPTTTESRTDCEINTSQIDSSGLEELPLKKDARQSIEVKGIQSRIRSQAGKLRQKICSISKPKLNSKEKPKIKLPEKPKINLPKQSRLKIPERPKFNFPQRPKISLPNFNFVKTKNTNSNLPQEHMSDRSSSTGSNKNFFNSFRTYPRMFKKKKPNAYKNGKRAYTPPPKMETESTPPTPTSKKSNFSHQWTERYKDIKFADDESQSDKQKSFDDDVEDDSAPFRDTEFTGAINLEEVISKSLKTASSGSIQMSGKDQKSSVSSSERLQTGVIEEIDSDEFFLREKGLSREDVDISRFLSLEIRDAFRSPKNALASMEIDSELYDRDDYDLEPTTRKNLMHPMRRSIEAMSREFVEPMRMTPELEQNKMEEIINYCQPSRPTRTRSLKKQSKQNKIEDFNTFPPPRPNRSRKQSISKQSLEKYDIGSEESLARPSSVPSLSVSDTSKDQKFEIDKDSSSEAVNWQQPPLPPKRRKSSSKDLSYKYCLEKDQHENENWKRSDDVEIMVPEKITALQLEATNEAAILSGYYDSPSFPLNQKQQSRGTSLADEDRTSRGAESFSSETRETLGEDSVLNEINVNLPKPYDDYAVVEKPHHSQRQSQLSVPSDKKKTTTQIRALKNHGINFFFTYPRRAIRSLQKEMPVRPIRNYSSIRPSRPPRRNRVFREPVYVESEIIPLKNETSDSEIKTEQIIKGTVEDINKFISNEEDVQETRDLQSGDVIEKMKGRPLPPPPRPPRKNKEDSESRQEEHLFEGSNIQVTDLDESDDEGTTCVKENITEDNTVQENLFLESVNLDFSELCDNNEKHSFPNLENMSNDPPVKKERKRKSLSHSSSNLVSQNPYFTFGETSVSTQTDPLSEYLLSTCEDVTVHDNVENQNIKKSLSCDSEYLSLKSHKMKLSELDVEQLKVHDLQAQRIIVSEIDSVTMQISEISSKSGHLVINGIELPNSFLENLNPPIQTSTPGVHQQTQSSIQTETKDSETMTEVHNTCTIYQSEPLESQQSRNEFTSNQVPTEENLNQLTIEKKTLNSSSDEDILTRRESATRQCTQDINATELAKQLVKIWQKSFLRGVNKVVDAFPEAEKSKDALTAACIVVVLIAGLMIMGLGQERTVHHHHWDFIPPSI